MTRYSRVVRKRKNRIPGFLPESWQAFLARRLIDITGFAVMGAGALLTLALVTYNHADPSWNTAGSGGPGGQTANWLGLPGAWYADILLQTLGLAGFIPGLVLMAWGARVLRRHSVYPLWARFVTAMLAMLLASVALARLPAGVWLVHPWMGGSGGTIMLNSLSAAARGWGLVQGHTITAILAAIPAGLFLLHACAVNSVEARIFFTVIWRRGVVAAARFAYGICCAFVDWVRHYGDPEFAPRQRLPRIARSEPSKQRRAPRLSDIDDEKEEESAQESAAMGQLTAVKPASIRVMAGARKKEKQKAEKQARPARQTSFALDNSAWELPPIDLLQDVPADDRNNHDLDEEALRKNAEMLHNVLNDFNVNGEIVSIHPGPVVTLYELEPAPGVKTSRVIGLSDDIARSMAAVSVRCAVIPGRNVIGIELPNTHRQTVHLRDLLESEETQKTRAALPLVLGKDIGGHPIIADLAKMPHLLVAGTTGSGKSVAVNTMILSLLYRLPPEKCRFIMIDPKMLELSVYDDIPHLLSPVVTEPGKAVVALKWAVQEMEERYRAMSKLGVRNIEGYNERLRQALKKGETLMRKVQTGFDIDTGKPVYEEQPLDMTELPYIVIVVDEFADLMLVAGKDVENAVQRLAQMARAAGIHLIMATQRPSVDVITGVIKANFPTRISFQVTSKVDSRTILNEGGAEQLLGMGDMLYMAGGGRITRVHGPFVSDEDVEGVVSFLKNQGEPSYITDVTEGGFGGDSEVMSALFGGGDSGGDGSDDLFDQAVALVARERKASTSFIQRHLQIGYNRAARIVEDMEKRGIIGPANHVGKREVLVGDYSDA